MQYRSFGQTGVSVSALGFGTMRLPQREDGTMDEAEAIRIIRHAIDNGVTYLDTAYRYHDGNSEPLLGKALKDGYRQKVLVATKSPIWMIETPEDYDRIFEDQRQKLGVDKVDMYLFHALNRDTWAKMQKLGLLQKAEALKEAGKIGHIGFSFHDDYETFLSILNGYDKWEFCQLQYNYVDVENQAGTKGLDAAAAKGLGIIVMEPLLGGKLANLPENVQKNLPANKSSVEWALDYLWNDKRVSLLLSGMSNAAQVEDNLLYASRSHVGMLTKDEEELFPKVREVYLTMAKVPCTKCSYCMPCPFGVNIPGVFEAYNRSAIDEKAGKEAYASLSGADSARCKTCHKCEKVCPQHIAIPDQLAKAGEELKQK